MSAVVNCGPAENARRAAWWRKYARVEGATPEQVAEREATAAAYQAIACTAYVADRHDRGEAMDG